MKRCERCGTENWDICTHCEKCNSLLTAIELPVLERDEEFISPPTYDRKPPQKKYYMSTEMTTAAKVFMLIATVLSAILCISVIVLWGMVTFLEDEYGMFKNLLLLEMYIALAIVIIRFLVQLFMTIFYFGKIGAKQKVSVAFKVCVLLFVDFIAGLLMLLDRRDNEE